MKELAQPSTTSASKNVKKFVTSDKELYYWGSSDTLARALSTTEAYKELWRIHELSCGISEISLYSRLQQQVYY